MRKARAFAVLFALLAAAGHAQTVRLIGDLPTYSTREAQTPFVVTAVDSNNQPVSSYRGTVTFSASDSSVDVPPDYTFTAADAGQHTFYVVFHRGYLHSVGVTDTVSNLQGGDETNVLCPDLTATATNSGPICPGGTVTLTATTNATNPSFNWHPAHGGGGLVLTGQTVTTTVATLWEVYVTDADTGCLVAARTMVDYEPAPSIFGPDTASGDFTATLDGDPNGPYTDIVWSVTSGGSIVAGQGTPTVTIHPDASATRVYYAVAANRTTGCRRSSDTSTAISPAPLSAAITTSDRVCPHADGVASVPDAGAGATYFWSLTNASIVSGQGTPSIVFEAPASGTIELSATVSRNGVGTGGNATVSVSAPAATLVSEVRPLCAGTSTTIDVMLSGTPPFTLTWSDGMTQSGIMTSMASRSVSPAETTVYSIVGVSDASCGGMASGLVRIDVVGEPRIERNPENVAVRANGAATLTVSAAGDPLMFQWYQGESGDVSHPVGGNSSSFTTPPIDQPARYWVKVMNPCGSAASAAATVFVARGRAARH